MANTDMSWTFKDVYDLYNEFCNFVLSMIMCP